RAERVRRVAQRWPPLRRRGPRPAPDCARPAVGWHLSPGLVQARPARGQRQGARWPVRPPTYAGCATDRAVRIGAGPGPARGREVHGTVRIGLQRAEPDAAAGEPADQHLLGFSPRLGIPRPGALRDPRQLQLQANRAPSGIRCVLATPATTQAPWLRLCLPGLWPPRIAWRTAELRARHGADSHCAPVTDRRPVPPGDDTRTPLVHGEQPTRRTMHA